MLLGRWRRLHPALNARRIALPVNPGFGSLVLSYLVSSWRIYPKMEIDPGRGYFFLTWRQKKLQ